MIAGRFVSAPPFAGHLTSRKLIFMFNYVLGCGVDRTYLLLCL